MHDFVSIDGARLEYAWHGPPPAHAPTMGELMSHNAGFTYGLFGNTPAVAPTASAAVSSTGPVT